MESPGNDKPSAPGGHGMALPLARRLRTAAWAAYVLSALAAAAFLTYRFPLWFRDDDGAFLAFASRHGLREAFLPSSGSVQEFFRPLSVAAFWLAYKAFGLTYWPYQFLQVLLTFGVWAAFYAMLRQFWSAWRPAVAATLLHAVVFASMYYFTFRFSQVNYQLELLLGFCAAALGAWSWRRKDLIGLAATLLLVELTYAAKEPACVYLPILLAWAAAVLGRRAGVRWRWILLWLAALAAITAGHVWLVKRHLALLAIGGQLPMDAGFVLERLRYYSGVLNEGARGWLLAALAAVACAAQAARLRGSPRRKALTALLAAIAAGSLSRLVHPIIPVVACSLGVLPALPFALGALSLVAVTAQLEPQWSIYMLQASWLMIAALAGSMSLGPLPRVLQAARRTVRRMGLPWRGLAVVAAGAAVLAATPKALRLFDALDATSCRRRIARDLTQYLTRHAPPRAILAIPVWQDIGTTHQIQHGQEQLHRAEELTQWYPQVYHDLLTAYGRQDILVVEYSQADSPDIFVMATSLREMQAAHELLARLPLPRMPQPLVTVQCGRQKGALWYSMSFAPHDPKGPSGEGLLLANKL